MTITAASNSQAAFFGEFDQVLQAQDGGGDKGVLGFILNAFTPILKTNPLKHLHMSAMPCRVVIQYTFMIFFFSASS